ncbi:hypothetical protein V8F33_004397 [Rhypophila sp. PSN 637]
MSDVFSLLKLWARCEDVHIRSAGLAMRYGCHWSDRHIQMVAGLGSIKIQSLEPKTITNQKTEKQPATDSRPGERKTKRIVATECRRLFARLHASQQYNPVWASGPCLLCKEMEAVTHVSACVRACTVRGIRVPICTVTVFVASEYAPPRGPPCAGLLLLRLHCSEMDVMVTYHARRYRRQECETSSSQIPHKFEHSRPFFLVAVLGSVLVPHSCGSVP